MNETKAKNEWIEWGKAVLIAVLLAFSINFLFSTSIVEGESMEPTIEDGNRIVFNKFVYFIGKPDRGDVVIIQRAHKNYVKRIIALPGETIEIYDHVLYIDDEPQEQTFLPEQAINLTGNYGPVVTPDDSYFVMGDNRAISKDSRNGLGFIKEGDIIGRSEFIFYPFNDWAMTR